MNGGYDTVDRVGNKNGDTISRPYPDGNPRKSSYKRIKALQLLPRHPRPVDDGDPGTVYLMPLDDGIG